MLRILKFYIVLKYYDNVCLMLQEQKAYPNTTKGQAPWHDIEIFTFCYKHGKICCPLLQWVLWFSKVPQKLSYSITKMQFPVTIHLIYPPVLKTAHRPPGVLQGTWLTISFFHFTCNTRIIVIIYHFSNSSLNGFMFMKAKNVATKTRIAHYEISSRI